MLVLHLTSHLKLLNQNLFQLGALLYLFLYMCVVIATLAYNLVIPISWILCTTLFALWTGLIPHVLLLLIIIQYNNQITIPIHTCYNNNLRVMQPQMQQPLCSHISKLSKQSIEQLQKFNYIGVCSECKQILHNNEKTNLLYDVNVNLNICLHCAAVFCLKNDRQCLNKHLDQKHVFWGKFRVKKQVPSLTVCSEGQANTHVMQNILEIMCKYCGSINKLLSMANNDSINEQLQKLTRFSNFITPILHNLPTIIHNKFQQNEQLTSTSEIGVFGLANLGNTCFLNSILQILFYTHPLRHLYASLPANQTKKLYLISQDKNKRKQMQYFYDQTVDKFEANSWHVVGDRKKNKQKLKNNIMEKFVADGLVKDSKFNNIFKKFIVHAASQVSMQSRDKVILEPVQLLTKLGEFDPKYKMQQEQDAEELLVFIIDLLSQGEMADIYATQKDAKQRYRKIEELLGRQKLSPIQQIFGSYLASKIVCHGCKSQSWSIDFTYHYPIPVQPPPQKQPTSTPTSPITNLQIPTYPRSLKYPSPSDPKQKQKNILYPLLCPQRLTNKDNYYNCQKCGHLSGTKQFYILDSPQILVISLKRFQYGKKFKINKHVEFREQVDISAYLLRQVDQDGEGDGDGERESCRYEIYGVVVHKGQTINSGHYICYVKVNKQKQKPVWMQFSDEKARKVTSKQVYRQQAYMLLYRKISN